MLKEFNCSTRESWNGDIQSYALEMLSGIDSGDLEEMHQHLTGGKADVTSELQPWKEGFLKLFLSHLVVHKNMVGEIKRGLAAYGIDAFVAHDSIEPTKEWMEVIDAALMSCDAGAAFLHKGFSESRWCDQEVGYLLARRVPVLPLMFENTPYGFLSKYQGIPCIGATSKVLSAEEITTKIVQWLSNHPATQSAFTDALVNAFTESASFARTRQLWPLITERQNLSPDHLRRLEQAAKSNSQVSQANYSTSPVPDLVRGLVSSRTSPVEIPF